MPQALREILDSFPGKRVLVVGDLYLDEYINGRMEEISREGPVPVIHMDSCTRNPGAAGNTACGMAALGARVWAVGVLGLDANGDLLRQELVRRGVETAGLVTDGAIPTNTYTKISAGATHTPRQEVLRVDTPRPSAIVGDIEREVLDSISLLAPRVQAIVVVDQANGVVTPAVLALVTRLAREHHLLLVGDSRERASSFRGFDLILPNDEEAAAAAGLAITDEATLREVGRRLCLEHGNRLVIITRGKHGMSIFDQEGNVSDVPTYAQEAFDVTGAGDTVTATCTLALLAGASAMQAAMLGNYAAGVAVALPGTVTVTPEQIKQAMARATRGSMQEKCCTLEQASEMVAAARAEGKRIVLTNGCFDILHAGHVAYLEQARALGDLLVVGLNSDESVRALKGQGRPVNVLADRARVLGGLACVDLVVPFGESTAEALIRALRPEIYAKGGDYTLETVNQDERQAVCDLGGRYVIVEPVPGHSTTGIIERITAKGASNG